MSSVDKNELPKDSSFRQAAILDSLRSLENENGFLLCACVMWNATDVWLIRSTDMTEYPLEIHDPFWIELRQSQHRFVLNLKQTIDRFGSSPFLRSFKELSHLMCEPVLAHDGTQLASLLVISKNDQDLTLAQHEHVAATSRQIGRNLELELIQLKISKMTELINASAKWRLGSDVGELVVHEINNPLSVIRSRLKMALDGFELENPPMENIRRHIEKSFAMTERVGKIIEGVRALAHDTHQIAGQRCLLHHMIDDVKLICEKHLQESGAEFSYHFTENLALHCNPVQISQILVNLITNASDAFLQKPKRGIPFGGLTLAGQAEEAATERAVDGATRGATGHAAGPATTPEKKIRVFGYQNDTHVFLEVSDTGPGIPAEYRDQIFNPFFTTKKSSGGTGVGLALTQKIVQAHGGTLELVKAEKPTTFRVTFPQKMSSATE